MVNVFPCLFTFINIWLLDTFWNWFVCWWDDHAWLIKSNWVVMFRDWCTLNTIRVWWHYYEYVVMACRLISLAGIKDSEVSFYLVYNPWDSEGDGHVCVYMYACMFTSCIPQHKQSKVYFLLPLKMEFVAYLVKDHEKTET